MLEFFEGSPVKIVCDNLKTGVITHPKHGEIVLNDAYLSFAEHYQIAIMPAEVRKPKQKSSVEGSIGKIARKIIGMLRNEFKQFKTELKRLINSVLKNCPHISQELLFSKMGFPANWEKIVRYKK